MSKKDEFINYVEDLMNYTRKMDAPIMSENAEMYWTALKGKVEEDKPIFTDNG